MSVTGQLGTADSQLGQIELGAASTGGGPSNPDGATASVTWTANASDPSADPLVGSATAVVTWTANASDPSSGSTPATAASATALVTWTAHAAPAVVVQPIEGATATTTWTARAATPVVLRTFREVWVHW